MANDQQQQDQQPQIGANGLYVYEINTGTQVKTSTNEIAPALINCYVDSKDQTIKQLPVPRTILNLSDAAATISGANISGIILGIVFLGPIVSTDFYISGLKTSKNLYMAITTQLINNEDSSQVTNFVMFQTTSENTLANIPQYNFGLVSTLEYVKDIPSCLSLDILEPTVVYSSSNLREIFFTDTTQYLNNDSTCDGINFIFYSYVPADGYTDLPRTLPPSLVKWRDQLVMHNGSLTTIANVMLDHPSLTLDKIVQNTNSDQSINYLSLLYYDSTDVSSNYKNFQRVSITQSINITTSSGDSYILHITPDLYFFTSMVPYLNGNFADLTPFPSSVNNSKIQWQVMPVISSDGKVTTQGIPLVREVGRKIISVEVNGQMIIASTINNILYYNLTLEMDENGLLLPILQESRAVALEDTPSPTGNIIMAGNNLHFVSADKEHKAIITSEKFFLTTISKPIIPTTPLVPKNTYTLNSNLYTLYPPLQLKFLKVGGERFVSIGESLICNIQGLIDDASQCTYSYLRSSEIVNYTATIGSTNPQLLKTSYPKRITATSKNGLMIGLEDKIIYFPNEFNTNIETVPTNTDPFDPSVIVLKEQYFVGRNQNVVIDELLTTFKITTITEAFAFGYVILTDTETFQDLTSINANGQINYMDDNYWILNNWVLNYEVYEPNLTNQRATYTVPLGQSLRGMMLILRLGSYNTPTYTLAVGKSELQSILFKIRN